VILVDLGGVGEDGSLFEAEFDADLFDGEAVEEEAFDLLAAAGGRDVDFAVGAISSRGKR
jgi:hypothetical protein